MQIPELSDERMLEFINTVTDAEIARQLGGNWRQTFRNAAGMTEDIRLKKLYRKWAEQKDSTLLRDSAKEILDSTALETADA